MREILDQLPDELLMQVVDELTDSEFITRTHGTASCYNSGCQGPLCSKFNRDRSRERYRKKNPTKRARKYEPSRIDRLLDLVIAEIKREKSSHAVA